MLKTKEIQAVITSANVGADIKDSNLNVVIGEAAKLETQQAVNYIKSGQVEIAEAVSAGKRAFNANAEQKTAEFNNNATAQTGAFNSNYADKINEFNANATEKTNTFNQNAADQTAVFNSNAANKTGDFDTNATNKTTDFNNNYTEKKALIDAEVETAETAAVLSKQWAIGEPTEPSEGSAKYWAEQASQSVPNNGQLDIQVNGSSVATFTANQSGNTTADITIPSSLPDQTGNAGKVLGTDGTDASWQYSITDKGMYSAITQYYPGDLVRYYYNNTYAFFLCRNATLGTAPGGQSNAKWMPFQTDTILLKNTWGDQPILPFLVAGNDGSSITKIWLTAGTPSTVANFPTINTSTGLLKAPGGINGYYTSAQVDALIPTVNDSTITFTQGGVNKGSFTLNQSSGATIALDAGGGGGTITYTAATETLTWS